MKTEIINGVAFVDGHETVHIEAARLAWELCPAPAVDENWSGWCHEHLRIYREQKARLSTETL